MTAITGYVRAQKRPGELGVHSLDHFHFNVPDLSVAQNFYSEFGLDMQPLGGARLAIKTFGHGHTWGTIGEGSRKKLGYLSFGAYEEDIGGFAARLSDLGIARIDPPPGIESNGLWFLNPDGVPIEIKVAPKSSPDEKSGFAQPSVGPGQRGAPANSAMPRTRPRRLAHALLFTPDVERSVNFYIRVLGLRLSDRSGWNIAFMHGIHGSDHHMIALARSNAPGHHHWSWDVGSVNEIGAGAKHMLDKGFQKGWGLGRHVVGANLFHYVQDPWGSFSEYSADIDYVPVDHDWDAQDHPGEDSFYVWGPNCPADFVHNYEAD